MTGRHATFSNKARDAVGYMIALFLLLPGLLFFLGIISGVPLALVGGLLTIYYLVAFFLVIAEGAGWLDRHLK